MGRVHGFFTEFWCCEDGESDKICVTTALKGGVVKSLYQNRTTKEIIEINPAAGSIFLHVLKKRVQCRKMRQVECKSGKNGIYISVMTEKEKIKEPLEEVIRMIFEHAVTEPEFEEAKQRTIDKLKQNFKNATARSWYYMFEFTEMGKKYAYNKLAKALETISYQEFYMYTEALVTPQNSIIIGNGMLEQREITSICDILTYVRKAGTEYADYGYVSTEEGMLDCHLVKNMPCSSMGALYFQFPDRDVTPTEKIFLLMYINEIMFRKHGFVSADTFDASIVYFNEPICKYEKKLSDIWVKGNIENARERLLEHFGNFIRNPVESGVFMGELFFSGVDVYTLIREIQVCDADMVCRVYKNADIKVSSGAIINNEGGSEDDRRSGIKTK